MKREYQRSTCGMSHAWSTRASKFTLEKFRSQARARQPRQRRAGIAFYCIISMSMERLSGMFEQPVRSLRDRPFVQSFYRHKHSFSHALHRRSIITYAAAAFIEVPTWQQLSASAGASALEGYVVRRNEVPRSAPTPTLPTEADAETDKPVLLYRWIFSIALV